MADENAPRDASAKEVLKAFQELKPELTAARRELAQTRGEIRAAKPGEPTVTRGGRGMAQPATTEEVQRGTRAIESATLGQATEQLAGCLGAALQPVGTVVEKRATFACVPNLVRPPMTVAPHLLACGDYVEGPFPATLEGAVRSGIAAAAVAVARGSGENPA